MNPKTDNKIRKHKKSLIPTSNHSLHGSVHFFRIKNYGLQPTMRYANRSGIEPYTKISCRLRHRAFALIIEFSRFSEVNA